MSTSFEQLKREAVNLERQLEDKIGRYQQVRKNYEEYGNAGFYFISHTFFKKLV